MSKVKVEFLSGLPEIVRLGKMDEEISIDDGKGGSGTVRNLLDRLALEYPRFGELYFDTQIQELNGRLSIFCNGRRLELANGLDTRLKDGDVIILMPPIEGG